MYLLNCHKFNLNLWWSAKCGCSYIKNFYHNVILNRNIKNIHRESYNAFSGNEITGHDRNIYICRNPYARIVSSYVDKYVRVGGRTGNLSFSAFANILYDHYVNKKSSVLVDHHHTAPQFSEAFPIVKDFKFTEVIKLESLTDEILYNIFKKQANSSDIIKKDFGHTNNVQKSTNPRIEQIYNLSNVEMLRIKNQRKIPHFTCFYNDEICKKIEEIYAIDFENLEKYSINYKCE